MLLGARLFLLVGLCPKTIVCDACSGVGHTIASHLKLVHHPLNVSHLVTYSSIYRTSQPSQCWKSIHALKPNSIIK